VVLVGFDGADWRVIRPMMDQGKLPAFTRLAREGATGDLATIHDSNSAVIWASIYTGSTPERHTVQDFYRIRLPGMASRGIFPVHRTFFKELSDLAAKLGLTRQVPVDRFSLAAPPLWEIADRAGLSIGVVDAYFYSFPALRPSRPESWFLSYGLDELSDRASPRARMFAQPIALFRKIRPLLKEGDFYWQSGALLELLAERPQPRFVNFYTHQPDSFQHWYWKWYEPAKFFGVTARGSRENADRIPRVHRDFDSFLGRLLAELGPDTVVIVASDHGHSPTIVHSLYTQHRHGPPGILLMRGGPVKRGLVLQGAGIYDVYPTFLYLLGLPVPQDAAGKVLLGALDEGFVRLHPVRTVPSYAGLGLPPGLPGASRSGEMNEREIEKLRSLGYIF
jgi:type I phosphodiesterase/nucleotide pyrophosphatase